MVEALHSARPARRRGLRGATGTSSDLIEDEELRANLLAAYGAARSAYGRMSNGKPASKALFEDRKLQHELREAADALRDAANTLREPPRKRRRRRGGGIGRTLLLLLRSPAVLALALSEGLRAKVLDLLFGAEDEFEYSSTTAPVGRPRRCPRRPPERPIAAAARWRRPSRTRDRGTAAAAPEPRRVAEGEKAQRIVEAMRRSVAVVGRRAPPSTTSRARPASRGGCCTTTSAPRSSCSPRRCVATASCAWSCSSGSSRARARRRTSSA